MPATSMSQPSPDCPHCPRLALFRQEQRVAHPDWFNAPVPPFGDRKAWLAIVGLAPGLKGANRTGRAFTGDGSGALLFSALSEQGLAIGPYRGNAADDVRLKGAIIVNAVRCVPPANRPTPSEMRACRPYLRAPLEALPSLRVIVALGRFAHDATLEAIDARRADHRFGHGTEHRPQGRLIMIDSYHCSRYNQNIGRITHKMLCSIFEQALRHRQSNLAQSTEYNGFLSQSPTKRA